MSAYSIQLLSFCPLLSASKPNCSQLWQAFSKALGERVTKKNLFLVLKQYLLSRTGETMASDQLSVTLELVEVIDPLLTLTTNQLPVTADLVEASYSEDSEQLTLLSDRGFLVNEDSSQLERAPQQCQNSCDNTEAKNNLKAPVTQSEPTISRGCLPPTWTFRKQTLPFLPNSINFWAGCMLISAGS